MKEKKSFLIYKDTLSILDKLSNDQCCGLFKAIADYQCHGAEPSDHLISLLFEPFKNQFVRDNDKYIALCEKNKRIAEDRYKSTTGNHSLPNLPNVTKSTDRDSDKDSDSNNHNTTTTPHIVIPLGAKK